MLKSLRTALIMLLTMTILTGGIYPLIITGIAQLVYPRSALGSLRTRDGVIVGSELIGQSFSRPEYFWGRLSATVPVPYNAAASSGSNLGPLNPALKQGVSGRIAALKMVAPVDRPVPVDLVTASGSGLDPHISPAAAEFQVARVAKARMIAEDDVRELVRRNTEGRQFGILGEPRVNVLGLNLALDELQQH